MSQPHKHVTTGEYVYVLRKPGSLVVFMDESAQMKSLSKTEFQRQYEKQNRKEDVSL
jgi:hypothetical protein